MEMGRSLNSSDYTTPIAFDRMTLETRSLPSATMATFIPPAESCGKLLGYNAIATWAEANHYDLVGAARLVFLKLPQHPGDTDFITEIQFPIRKRKVDLNWQSLSK